MLTIETSHLLMAAYASYYARKLMKLSCSDCTFDFFFSYESFWSNLNPFHLYIMWNYEDMEQ